MRATKFAGAKAAIKRLEETLIWRREYGVYDLITADHVEPEVRPVCHLHTLTWLNFALFARL